ncbi:MAG: sigma-70 family RNA polymerase sigma factor, partial [Planctomycetota bacterium]
SLPLAYEEQGKSGHSPGSILNQFTFGASKVVAMISPSKTSQINENELWSRVLQNDASAFEKVVSRYQAAVSAVCFSSVGEFAASEDISQETFLVAWQAKDKLENATKLKAWLCGIARTLSKNYLRKTISHREQAARLAQELGSEAERSDSAETRAMEREEEALVWSTLSKIDETYREPLVLFYREGQSIANIAEALDISEAAAKQRLSRGRNLLKANVAELVGSTLGETRPDSHFTAGVMAAISAGGFVKTAASATSLAGSISTAVKGTAAATKLVGSAGAAGVAGGLLGAGFGLLGGWLGVWIPAQLAPTIDERRLLESNGKRIMRRGIGFTAVIFLAAILMPWIGTWIALAAVLLGSLFFIATTIVESTRVQKQVKALRRSNDGQLEPNETALRTWVQSHVKHREGRVYRSKMSFLGRPLLDIQVSDPPTDMYAEPKRAKTARGWIAIGDNAQGLILAIGSRAQGLIAFGGRAYGIVAVGGLAVGGIAVGGLSLGLLSLGGGALGILAIGGLGIGWDAAGGGAIAWHAAAGGGALAYEGAFGGLAIAKNFAAGGTAFAAEVGTEAANLFLDSSWPKRLMEFTKDRTWLVWILGLSPVLLQTPLVRKIFYRTVPENESANQEN